MSARPANDAQPIRITLVEDKDRVRQQFLSVFNRAAGMICVGAHPDAKTALERIPVERPDVVLMDIRLEGMSGIECVRRLKQRHPHQLVVMLTSYHDDHLIFEALAAGANGYLLKQCPPAELVAGVRDAHRGGSPMSSTIARKIMQSFKPAPGIEKLTPRELEILQRYAAGATYKEVAEALGIAYYTVNWHTRGIYAKLHVNSRQAAVAKLNR